MLMNQQLCGREGHLDVGSSCLYEDKTNVFGQLINTSTFNPLAEAVSIMLYAGTPPMDTRFKLFFQLQCMVVMYSAAQ